MNTVAVLGLGNFGTALANHLAMKGLAVSGWCKDEETANAINSEASNPRYLKGIKLSPNLKATTSLDEALVPDVVVLAFPSSALSEVVPRMAIRESTILVSVIKGLVRDRLLTPTQYLETSLGLPAKVVTLSGPSFAADLVTQRPSGVVAASQDEVAAKKVADLFSSDYLRVYTSSDTIGVEIGGVVKNVIALAAGVIDGMELGESARAGLITRGLAEMMRLAQAMGAQPITLSGLSGLGDLIMTATSEKSRNRTVGYRLGRGEALPHILDTLGSVAEGVKSTDLVVKLAEKYSVEMPITFQVSRLLEGTISSKEMVKTLLARPLKREF